MVYLHLPLTRTHRLGAAEVTHHAAPADPWLAHDMRNDSWWRMRGDNAVSVKSGNIQEDARLAASTMEAKLLEQELQLKQQGAELQKLRDESNALKASLYAGSERRHADAGQQESFRAPWQSKGDNGTFLDDSDQAINRALKLNAVEASTR